MKAFPTFDFKIDCGDDSKVRQWLHDNGVTFGIFGTVAPTVRNDRLVDNNEMIERKAPLNLGFDIFALYDTSTAVGGLK